MLLFRRVFAVTADGNCVHVKRHCSISPQGLASVYGALAAVSLGIAVAFAALGAWLILPFAGLEIAALCAAFWVTARRAGQY